MPRYAQVDVESGFVVSDSYLRDEGMEKKFPHLIPISDSFDLTGKMYDFKKKKFVDIPEPVEEEGEANEISE